MQLFMSRIKYLGQIIDANGRRPDPSKLRAIRDMPTPTTVTKLQAFLGFANHNHRYIPNMHELRVMLNNL